MKVKMALVATVVGAMLMGSLFSDAPVWAAKKDDKAQKQAEVRKTVNETLNRLYKLQPASKGAIQKAAGYAVFSNFGMKIFVAGSGTGKGIAVNNASKKETFMKMVELQAGLGFGVKKFRLVWVFQTRSSAQRLCELGLGTGHASDRISEVR